MAKLVKMTIDKDNQFHCIDTSYMLCFSAGRADRGGTMHISFVSQRYNGRPLSKELN
jgi:hypothetical protein